MPAIEPPPPPRPGAARRRPPAPPWTRWLLSLLGGLLLAALAGAWLTVAHTVPLPAAWLRIWPAALPASLAYWAHAVVVMALPLGALGWAGGAVLQHTVPLQRQAAGLRLVAMLPWLLGCPALALHWALGTAQPLHTLGSLAAGGQFAAAWLALPAGLAWATRARRRTDQGPRTKG